MSRGYDEEYNIYKVERGRKIEKKMYLNKEKIWKGRDQCG